MKRLYFLAFLCFQLLYFRSNSQTLIINEILSSNTKVNTDGFGEHDDWVEIYNPTNDTIQTRGMYITNDSLNPTKHEIGSSKSYWTQVPPKSYILFWLDGDPEQGQRHISFSIKKKGGYLAIFDKDTTLLDAIQYEKQEENKSIGRVNHDAKDLAIFKKPTPNDLNAVGKKINTNKTPIEFNLRSGFYKVSQKVSLSCSAIGPIYYTLNGSIPTSKSALYDSPIIIDSNTVVRARLILPGYVPNQISTASYFINENSKLSVVSLIVDPKDLWRKNKGIYSNFEKRGMEVPVYVEYFDTTENGTFKLAISKTGKTRIAGKTSRRQPKKSFAFFATNEDGKGDRFNYPVFKDKDINSFSGLWVRADATSGRNVSDLWVGERFKNELLYEVNKQMSGNIDMQAYEPVSVFLNGKYWGLYNLMERKGKDFIKNNHGEKDVDMLTSEDAKVVTGNISEYDQLMFDIAQNDITTDSVYQEVCNQININSYIDYWVNEAYCGAKDVNVNIRFWKSKTPGAKWQWISYDQDSWYTSQEKSLNYYIDNGKVFLLVQLMKNNTFRELWINRMCDYLNTGFHSENVISLVDQITNRIKIETDRDKNRWADSMLYIPKGERIKWIKSYAVERPEFLRKDMIQFFQLKHGISEIQVTNSTSMGRISVNTIETKGEVWKGKYLQDVPITLKAIPNPGYKFVKWKNIKKNTLEPSVMVMPKKRHKFKAIFERI